ncbi:zinc finger protein 675 isoform X1 [Aedes aegypti]|uniref:Uncharacterized protein n=2 Tax=Aedes aegypti TaxID=7159 RepID=A0A1S4EUN7_AEDAE|nr:zinc finger protein 675 isoform X1 [Aedes aegypti]
MAISVENYLLCCRICLRLEKNDCFFDIHSTTLPESNVKVQEALMKTTGVECTWDDHLPSKICQSCQLRLQDAFNFIMECCDNSVLLESFKREALEHFFRANRIEVKELLNDDDEGSELGESHSTLQPNAVGGGAKEILQIERLETPNDNFMIFEIGEDFEMQQQQQMKVEPPEELVTAHDESTGEEIETNAVDFILNNLKPRERKRNSATGSKRKAASDKAYKCEVCGKRFQRKSNLVDHLRLHANVKLFSCSYCSASFVQAGNLKSHIRRHTMEKPYKCEYCGKCYTQSSALKTHVRSHTNERHYVCDVCQKGFTNSSDMNKHKMTHSDVRFYQCVVCVKRYFTQKVHLKKHLSTYHQDGDFDELLQQGTLKEGVNVAVKPKKQVVSQAIDA